MAFFLPSSTSTSTTTSLSSSPLPVLRQLDSEDESRQSDDGNGSLRHRRSEDFPSIRGGFTMFGLLSPRIEYISGASASDISSLESSSESEVESWIGKATFGDDDNEEDEFDGDDDVRHADMRRTSRSTRDARSPSRRGRIPDNNIQVHDEPPVMEVSVGTSLRHDAARTQATTDHAGPSTTTEPNVVASSTNQIEGEETVKRRNRSHASRGVDRRSARRVKLRNRRRDSPTYICKYAFYNNLSSTWSINSFRNVNLFHSFFFHPSLSANSFHSIFLLCSFHAARDFFLVITLCFGFACAWMVLARPIMMNWFGFVRSRSGDEYMYMDG